MTAEGSPHAEFRLPDGTSRSTDASDIAQRLGALELLG